MDAVKRTALDVSTLPALAFGPRSTLWWGVLGLLAIEGAALAIAVVALLYLRQNSETPPALGAATVNLVVLVGSVAVMIAVGRAARRQQRVAVAWGLVVMTLIGVVACGLRGFELAALNCRWDSHAYGSAVWLLLGMHAMHLVGATLENALLAAVIIGPVDPKHYVDAHSNALYWYFLVAAWVPVYAVVFVWPRWS
jgi:heme/copper-type cytochrome/quinol oxidase subunit 3